MNAQKPNFEELEQWDYVDEKYINKIINKYSKLIGLFLIKFSCLEHELNLAIAEIFSSRSHETGYVIIEKLSMNNKIELFYKMYIRIESFKDKKSSDTLKKIKEQLESVNIFRNNIVHANWQSLSKNDFVRTKIVIDNEEGYVKFKKVQINTKLIREKIKQADKLVNKLNEYCESALDF